MTTAVCVEEYLKVGQSAIFYPEEHRADGARHEVVIRGWEKDASILLEITPVPTRTILFREGVQCSLRFLKGGVACALTSTIEDWEVSRKKPAFRISWPKGVRTAAVRRGERIDLELPCTLYFDDAELSASMRDISVGGCGIVSPRSAKKDQHLVVSTTLPDGVYIDHAPLRVRNVRDAQNGHYYLGCMLENPESFTRSSIEFFVTTTLVRGRGEELGGMSLLFIDPDLQDGTGLPQTLQGMGCTVQVRSNLIDGISCARLRIPTAIVLRHEWDRATAIEFCLLVRTSPAFARLPIFVYGASGEAENALRGAGATSVYPELPSAQSLFTTIENLSNANKSESDISA